MNDPYQVLGVSPDASDNEIKQAYRALAKKYHPDNYAGSPLADLASEKMSQINAAYDKIQSDRKNGYRSAGRYQNTWDAQSGQSSNTNQYEYRHSQFSDIRRLISIGRIFDAEQLLDGVPASSRDAEWYFLKGNVLYSRGFLEDAFGYFQTAARMDPSNAEYNGVLEQLNRQRQFGYGPQGYAGVSTCSPCSLCSTFICANCACSTCRCCVGY